MEHSKRWEPDCKGRRDRGLREPKHVVDHRVALLARFLSRIRQGQILRQAGNQAKGSPLNKASGPNPT